MSAKPLNPTLWRRAHAVADKIYQKHSAYKSGYIVKYYKDHGGKFATLPLTRLKSNIRSRSRSAQRSRSKSAQRSRSRSAQRSRSRSAQRSRSKSTGLGRWFKERWVNQHGTTGYAHRNDVYRPSIRVSRRTPTTWSELSKKQITRASKEKATTGRVGRFAK